MELEFEFEPQHGTDVFCPHCEGEWSSKQHADGGILNKDFVGVHNCDLVWDTENDKPVEIFLCPNGCFVNSISNRTVRLSYHCNAGRPTPWQRWRAYYATQELIVAQNAVDELVKELESLLLESYN